MYGMVLMAAMTGTGDVAGADAVGCVGCTGYTASCSGYSAGCSGHHFCGGICKELCSKLCGRLHSGCHGAGCQGAGCYGAYAGCSGCTGVVVTPAPVPAPAPVVAPAPVAAPAPISCCPTSAPSHHGFCSICKGCLERCFHRKHSDYAEACCYTPVVPAPVAPATPMPDKGVKGKD